MPFFTVIIPLYNKENFVENTLKSVLNQSFSDFEVIIVNDGSTDKSEEKIKQFDDARIRYYHQENQGVSATRNLGIAHANANFIAFLDADDYWYPNFLQEMYNNIQLFPEEKVFSNAFEIETSKNVFPAQYSIPKSDKSIAVNYFDVSFKESAIWTSSSVFHKSVFERIGNFDTTIKSGEDTDLWIRIGLEYPVLFSWKILARYVYDEKSLSKKYINIQNKLNFTKFNEVEKSNSALKKFLDLNRFSSAIKSKLIGDKENFSHFCRNIDQRNLNYKKRILLLLPAFFLKKLIAFNLFLANNGIGKSVFK